jgi:hypothetical protein
MPIQNALKQTEASMPLILTFSLAYTIRKVQDNKEELELTGTHQLLVCADYVNLLGGNLNTIQKDTEV